MRRGLSLNTQGLKYKLRIAFLLILVLPSLIFLYLIFGYIGFRLEPMIYLLITILIIITGFYLLKEAIDRFLLITGKAKRLSQGDLRLEFKRDYLDEIGDLTQALDTLAQKIRLRMEELKTYGEKTGLINLEIQRKLLMLSVLLQLNSYIAERKELKDILKILVEKIRLLLEAENSFVMLKDKERDLFYVEVAEGLDSEYYLKIEFPERDHVIEKLLYSQKPLIVDNQHPIERSLDYLLGKFRVKNFILAPIFSRNELKGILFSGNERESFVYSLEDLELLSILIKQTTIAIEYDYLWQRLERLEIRDALTGLYNRIFIHQRLDDEIKRAMIYRRPCALVAFKINNFKQYHQEFGLIQTEILIKKVARFLKESISEFNYIGRVKDDEFMIILPEKSKHKAYKIAEEIQKKIEATFSSDEDPRKRITLKKAVSENPLDGSNAE
ncbi:MAG: diguanylate cyclase, partial [Candidatus Omnitrophica bacterium]|nr:diguanylate cyclase [Candidatus Omnitrophota bacterium]